MEDVSRLIFIIIPDNESLTQALRFRPANFDNCYVLIDQDGDFYDKNPHLPKSNLLHFFLLDQNNNVVVVGNPTRNETIKNLYLINIEELLGDNSR